MTLSLRDGGRILHLDGWEPATHPALGRPLGYVFEVGIDPHAELPAQLSMTIVYALISCDPRFGTSLNLKASFAAIRGWAGQADGQHETSPSYLAFELAYAVAEGAKDASKADVLASEPSTCAQLPAQVIRDRCLSNDEWVGTSPSPRLAAIEHLSELPVPAYSATALDVAHVGKDGVKPTDDYLYARDRFVLAVSRRVGGYLHRRMRTFGHSIAGRARRRGLAHVAVGISESEPWDGSCLGTRKLLDYCGLFQRITCRLMTGAGAQGGLEARLVVVLQKHWNVAIVF